MTENTERWQRLACENALGRRGGSFDLRLQEAGIVMEDSKLGVSKVV